MCEHVSLQTAAGEQSIAKAVIVAAFPSRKTGTRQAFGKNPRTGAARGCVRTRRLRLGCSEPSGGAAVESIVVLGKFISNFEGLKNKEVDS